MRVSEIETHLERLGNLFGDYQDLGWANAWPKKPLAYRHCCDAGHQHHGFPRGSAVEVYWCDICHIRWTMDSSD